MFDLKSIKKAIEQIAEEKGIDASKILEAIESSIAAAYKKEYGQKGEVIRAKFDLKTGELKFWRVKTVVDETTVRVVEEEEPAAEAAGPLRQSSSEASETKEGKRGKFTREKEEVELSETGEPLLPRYNEERHLFLEEAKKIKKDVQLGEELEFPLEPHADFGRIAAQTAKQVILQRLREAERSSILSEFQGKEGEIVSGVVQRFDRGNVFIDLGRATGIMFYNETIPGEHYRVGERLRFFVVAVQEESKIPGIILSRSHPKFVSKLFSLEVPEINDGLLEIKGIAREAGSRTKIAVVSKMEGVDPVGAFVGQRGTRVMAVSNELGNEKIDIVEWSEDPAKFIASAISPAKVTSVEVLPKREARIFVPNDQLSLAIGKGGQNVRLAAKLTNWKIDVRSQTNPEEVLEGGVAAAVPEVAPIKEEGIVDDGSSEAPSEEKKAKE